MESPLVLVTNDDGIHSRGLWAAVEALLPLGQVMVVAPNRQWSGGGRSMPPDVTGHVEPASRAINGEWVTAFAVDASPALTVAHGVLELAPRRPALVVSGINFGANLGIEVTISGTVGQNDGALGYVELAYALQNKLPYSSVQNKAGEYVKATTEAVQAAMVDFGTDMGDKLALSIANAPGKSSWPISTYTYLLIYLDQTDCAKGQKVIGFVKWALGDGTKYATELLYVPLPDAVKTQVINKLGKVTCQGKAF